MVKNNEELIEAYFENVRALKPCEEGELETIRVLFVNGDDVSSEQKNKLIESCLFFAAMKARNAHIRCKRNGFNVPVEDLIQAANKGLVMASGTYDGSTKFITHAVSWVKSCINRAILNERLVHIPERVKGSLIVLSLDEEKTGDYSRNDNSLLPETKDNRLPPPDELFDARYNLTLINSFLEKFFNCDKRDIQIVKRYYLDFPAQTLEEIANTEGLTREGVRLIIKNTTEKMKWFFTKQHSFSYVRYVSNLNLEKINSPDWFENLLKMKDSLEKILHYKDAA